MSFQASKESSPCRRSFKYQKATGRTLRLTAAQYHECWGGRIEKDQEQLAKHLETAAAATAGASTAGAALQEPARAQSAASSDAGSIRSTSVRSDTRTRDTIMALEQQLANEHMLRSQMEEKLLSQIGSVSRTL